MATMPLPSALGVVISRAAHYPARAAGQPGACGHRWRSRMARAGAVLARNPAKQRTARPAPLTLTRTPDVADLGSRLLYW